MSFQKKLQYSVGDLFDASTDINGAKICLLLNDIFIVGQKKTYFDKNPANFYMHRQYEPRRSSLLINGTVISVNSDVLDNLLLQGTIK